MGGGPTPAAEAVLRRTRAKAMRVPPSCSRDSTPRKASASVYAEMYSYCGKTQTVQSPGIRER